MVTPASDRSNSFAHQQRIENALRDREEVRWVGGPSPGAMGAGPRIAGLAGSLLLGFMAFHFFMHPESPLKNPEDADRMGNIIGLSIMTMMALLLIRVPWQRVKKLRHTIYLLTNQRVVILHPNKNRRDESMPLVGIDRVQVRKRSKRSGRVMLSAKAVANNRPSPRGTPLGLFCLRHLANPDAIARIIEEALPKKTANEAY